eukprot:3521406-Amphidinium_carterae.1
MQSDRHKKTITKYRALLVQRTPCIEGLGVPLDLRLGRYDVSNNVAQTAGRQLCQQGGFEAAELKLMS